MPINSGDTLVRAAHTHPHVQNNLQLKNYYSILSVVISQKRFG